MTTSIHLHVHNVCQIYMFALVVGCGGGKNFDLLPLARRNFVCNAVYLVGRLKARAYINQTSATSALLVIYCMRLVWILYI